MRAAGGTGLEGDNSPESTGKCEKFVKVGILQVKAYTRWIAITPAYCQAVREQFNRTQLGELYLEEGIAGQGNPVGSYSSLART